MEIEGSSRTAGPGRDPGKWAYVSGIAVVLGSEFVLRDVLLPVRPADTDIWLAVAVEWLIALALMVYWIPTVERKGLDSIGLGTMQWRHLWVGAVAYAVASVVMIMGGFLLESVGLESTRALQTVIKGYGIPTRLGLFLTGTFVEEVFYRGYLIERSTSLTGHRWLAAVASWVTFTLVHLKFFGVGPTLSISVLSAAFVLVYVKERSIWPSVVAHGLNGAIGYFVLPVAMP
jgi:membrane protease YdiL (CAAX protease family)